jgi:hypothetical protein
VVNEEAKRCTRCDEGVLTERMGDMEWVCPNPECLYSPPARTDRLPLTISGRQWERSQIDGLWYWAQVR